jgi:hypothetical protein
MAPYPVKTCDFSAFFRQRYPPCTAFGRTAQLPPLANQESAFSFLYDCARPAKSGRF